MHYIVALGNPGAEYEKTRHNVGWLLLDDFLISVSASEPVFSAKYQGRVSQGIIGDKEFLALYPDTFMNHSGVAVKKLLAGEKLDSLIVIHDEVALPLGEIKISLARGDGGHNGLRSIIKEVGGNEFIRIRVGIAERTFFTKQVKRPSGEALPKFVLGRLNKKELENLVKVGEKVNEALKLILAYGSTMAMNRFN